MPSLQLKYKEKSKSNDNLSDLIQALFTENFLRAPFPILNLRVYPVESNIQKGPGDRNQPDRTHSGRTGFPTQNSENSVENPRENPRENSRENSIENSRENPRENQREQQNSDLAQMNSDRNVNSLQENLQTLKRITTDAANSQSVSNTSLQNTEKIPKVSVVPPFSTTPRFPKPQTFNAVILAEMRNQLCSDSKRFRGECFANVYDSFTMYLKDVPFSKPRSTKKYSVIKSGTRLLSNTDPLLLSGQPGTRTASKRCKRARRSQCY